MAAKRTKYPTVVQDDFESGGEVIRVYDDHSDLMIVHREAAQDNRLQWKDRGLLWYLLSKPKDWQVRLQDLINSSPAGRDEVQGILSRLQKAGYMQRYRVQRADGTFVGWMSKVSAKPVFAQPEQNDLAPQLDPQTPQEAPGEEEAPKAATKWHPDLDRLMKAYCGTREEAYRNGWVGYKITDFVAQRQAGNLMLKDGYTFEEIERCYRHTKADRFWAEKPVSLMKIRKDIGEFLKTHQPKEDEPQFEPEGYALEFM